MPVVIVKMAAGRSLEQKQKLVDGIVDAVTSSCGVGEPGVHVLIDEYSSTNWADGKEFLADQHA